MRHWTEGLLGRMERTTEPTSRTFCRAWNRLARCMGWKMSLSTNKIIYPTPLNGQTELHTKGTPKPIYFQQQDWVCTVERSGLHSTR